MTNRDLIIEQYDLIAYNRIVDELNRQPNSVKRIFGKAGNAIQSAGKRVVDRLPDNATSTISQALQKSLSALLTLIREPSFRSIQRSRVLAKYQKLGYPITSLKQIHDLSMQTIDQAMPPLSFYYGVSMGIEGAIAGGTVTGAELLGIAGTTASAGAAAAPSAGLVIGAIAADTTAVIAGSMRVIAHVGAYFGHDVRSPEEQVFALSLLNWSETATSTAKTAAFKELSKVTQLLVRNTSKKVLGEHAVVAVVERMLGAIGFKMTKRKLGQAIPIIGIVIGAGLNAQIINSIAQDAVTAYRLRYLVQKYDLDPLEFGGVATNSESSLEEIDLDSFKHDDNHDDDPLI